MAETATYPRTPAETERWLKEGRAIEIPKSAPADLEVVDWTSIRTIPAALLKSLFHKETRLQRARKVGIVSFSSSLLPQAQGAELTQWNHRITYSFRSGDLRSGRLHRF